MLDAHRGDGRRPRRAAVAVVDLDLGAAVQSIDVPDGYGLQVAILFDGAGAVEAVRGSGGHVTEIDDEDAWEAQRLLAREEGVLVEPAGAVALAGLLADLRAGRACRDSEVVVVATGAGYKDEPALRRISGDDPLPVIDVESVGEVLARG